MALVYFSVCIYFCSIFRISFLLLTLGFFISSFSSCFRYRVRLFNFLFVFWGMPVLLWTFPLALLLLSPIGFRLLCFHFHSFLCIFWFLLWFVGYSSLQSKGLKNLLQHHNSKASILQRSAFFAVQLSQWEKLPVSTSWILGICLHDMFVSPFVLQRIKFPGASLLLIWAHSWRWLSVHAPPPCFVQPVGIQIQKSRGSKISYRSTQATTTGVLSSYDQVGSCYCFHDLLENFSFSFSFSLYFYFHFIYFYFLGINFSPSSLSLLFNVLSASVMS